MNKIIFVFGQGDEQPEFSWLDKVEWDFLTKTKEDTDRMIWPKEYDKNTNI